MSLVTVSDYIADTRTLLQDTVPPYRYPDVDLVEALNMAMFEASRLRPDLFLDTKYQTNFVRVQPIGTNAPGLFSVANESAAVPLPPAYKMPFVYFMVGQAQLRDTEDTQDKRAGAFLEKFIAQLISLPA
jgi:hypothetical protein